MKHIIISREYPPAAYTPGGIGTYVKNIAHLLVERGETVYIIGERWEGAPLARETSCGGRLVVIRIGRDRIPKSAAGDESVRHARELEGLKASDFPEQW